LRSGHTLGKVLVDLIDPVMDVLISGVEKVGSATARKAKRSSKIEPRSASAGQLARTEQCEVKKGGREGRIGD
jgi:hypothetical protein